MHKIISASIIYMLLSIFFCHAQSNWESLNMIKTLDVKAKLIATDKLGNLYTVNDQEIIKFDANGQMLQKNSIKSLGNIFSIDVSNPLKILAFFRDYNKVIFLDNMLATTPNGIDLSSIAFDQATLVCTSHDNGIWLYNILNFEIVRMDPSLKITHQSGNIAQLTGNAIKPMAMFETNNRVYLCDTIQGVLIFDVFGTYIKTIPIKSIRDLQVENNTLYFIDETGFGSFDLDLIRQTEIALPEKNIQQIRLQKNRVFMRLTDRVVIYGY
jgi:hypothetical protein